MREDTSMGSGRRAVSVVRNTYFINSLRSREGRSAYNARHVGHRHRHIRKTAINGVPGRTSSTSRMRRNLENSQMTSAGPLLNGRAPHRWRPLAAHFGTFQIGTCCFIRVMNSSIIMIPSAR